MPLLHRKRNAHKNDFGHILILAGSRGMLGAAALTGLAALRAGAGLVTVGIPQSLNNTLQKKVNHSVMTLPLPETKEGTIDINAYSVVKKNFKKYDVIAIGPGLSLNSNTKKFILKIIANSPVPLIIDADALNSLNGHLKSLIKNDTPKILTPHPGEMERLTGLKKEYIEKNRIAVAKTFAKKFNCVLLLKGNKTVIASPSGKIYVNTTGNPGMATAGSGDVLTGIISAFSARVPIFEAAKHAAFIHGKAGDLAAQEKGEVSLVATDIIDDLPRALKL